MKLDKFLCFMFLFAFLALTLHKTRQKHAFFGRITNQKLRLIYSILTCEPETKDCAGSRSVQHLIATVLFLLLKFPGFHNQSLDYITRNLRQNGGRPDSTQTFHSLRMAADRYREMYGGN